MIVCYCVHCGHVETAKAKETYRRCAFCNARIPGSQRLRLADCAESDELVTSIRRVWTLNPERA